MTAFELGPTDRVLIVGRTTSGKSTLARRLFYGDRQLVVVDPKHEEDLPRAIVVWTPREFAQAYPQRSTRILFRPNPEDARHDDLDEIIRRVLRYGRTRLLLHETVDYASPTRIVPALKRAQTTGASLGVPVVSLSQRPIGLHNVLVSEADHIFAFDLGLDGDRAKIAGVGGEGFLARPPQEHGFLYWGHRTTAGAVVSCPPLTLPASPPPVGAAAPQAAQPGGATWSGRPSAT